MTPRRIFAVDPSLTNSGWCSWLADATPIYGSYAPARLTGHPRLSAILGALSDYGVNHDLYVIEGISFGSKGRGLAELHGLQYLIRHKWWQLKLPIMVIPPASLKLFVTGKGNTHKDHMMLEVYKRFGCECSNSDEADAVGLAHLAACACGLIKATNEAQKRAIAKVEVIE